MALEVLDSYPEDLIPSLGSKISRPSAVAHHQLLALTLIALRFESTSIRNADEKDIAYHYLSTRLADLYEEIENPTPRGLFEKWLERRSGTRYVMLATLAGVVIAIFLGMAGLVVSAYQA